MRIATLLLLLSLCNFLQSEEFVFKWNNKNIRYFTAEPTRSTNPTIIIVHGVDRNPEDYFKRALLLHDKFGYGIIAIEISAENFPGSRNFQQGGLLSSKGELIDKKNWTFTMVNDLVLFLKKQKAFKRSSISIWGHSAGAQFVHRLALLAPSENILKYFSCNAGNYTALDLDTSYPYGIEDVKEIITQNENPRRQSLIEYSSESNFPYEINVTRRLSPKENPKANLIILVGDKDIDTDGENLSQTDGSLKQGANRFERAHYFVNSAENMNYKKWPSFLIMPNVNHSSTKSIAFFAEHPELLK